MEQDRREIRVTAKIVVGKIAAHQPAGSEDDVRHAGPAEADFLEFALDELRAVHQGPVEIYLAKRATDEHRAAEIRAFQFVPLKGAVNEGGVFETALQRLVAGEAFPLDYCRHGVRVLFIGRSWDQPPPGASPDAGRVGGFGICGRSSGRAHIILARSRSWEPMAWKEQRRIPDNA